MGMNMVSKVVQNVLNFLENDFLNMDVIGISSTINMNFSSCFNLFIVMFITIWCFGWASRNYSSDKKTAGVNWIAMVCEATRWERDKEVLWYTTNIWCTDALKYLTLGLHGAWCTILKVEHSKTHQQRYQERMQERKNEREWEGRESLRDPPSLNISISNLKINK